MKPWQFDPTKWTVRALEKLGLVSELRRVPDETIAMAEIREKQRCMALRLENHEETICEKAHKLFADAQEELHAAHEAWEQAKQNHMKALRQKLDATREQMAELQHKLEQSVEDLRRAMSDWHDAHQGLALKLA